MIKRDLFLIGLMAIFSMSIGCASISRVEMDYGTSYKLAKFNQILDLDAEKNLEPVTGFDGRADHGVTERYRKGFEEKSVAPVYSISIGGLGK